MKLRYAPRKEGTENGDTLMWGGRAEAVEYLLVCVSVIPALTSFLLVLAHSVVMRKESDELDGIWFPDHLQLVQ